MRCKAWAASLTLIGAAVVITMVSGKAPDLRAIGLPSLQQKVLIPVEPLDTSLAKKKSAPTTGINDITCYSDSRGGGLSKVRMSESRNYQVLSARVGMSLGQMVCSKYTLKGIVHHVITAQQTCNKMKAMQSTSEVECCTTDLCNGDATPTALANTPAADASPTVSANTTAADDSACAQEGNGECHFPFTYYGVVHTSCTNIGTSGKGTYDYCWCATAVDKDGVYVAGSGNYQKCEVPGATPKPCTRGGLGCTATTSCCANSRLGFIGTCKNMGGMGSFCM